MVTLYTLHCGPDSDQEQGMVLLPEGVELGHDAADCPDVDGGGVECAGNQKIFQFD